MSEHRWQRLRPLLEQALMLPPSERAAFVAALGADAADLREPLARLIAAAHTGAGADPLARVLAPERLAHLAENTELPDARVGQTLGAYRLVRVLGRGGMGSVYLAERSDGGFGQRVALKIVEGGALGGAARARFERERQLLATLRHPAIASLFDGGETRDGLPYYTMELVDGTNIDAHCRAHVPQLRGRVELVLEVAAALGYAHQRLIVHRDIKPGNVLVTTEGRVKLLDFGIAKPLGDDEAHVTQAALGPMTREYAAPEQFRGGDITVATDVYQLGVLCYRLLTASLPYRADPTDGYAWARAVSEDDPLPPERALGDGSAAAWSAHTAARVRRQLRGDLGAILRKALAKSPGDRYGSMDAFAADLRAFLTGQPVAARRAGAVYYAWRFLARRPYVSVGAALGLSALLATTLFAVRQAQIAEQEADRAQCETMRTNRINDFLLGLFKVSDPGVNRGEKLTANQILDRGAERIAREFGDDPPQLARLQSTIGEVYGQMGDLAKAKPVLESTVATLRKMPVPDANLLGHTLSRLGQIAMASGDIPAALDLMEQAKTALRKSSAVADVNELALVHYYAGTIQFKASHYDQALAEAAAAKELATTTGAINTTQAANVRYLLGELLLRSGKVRAAVAEYAAEYAIAERELGRDHPDTLQAKVSLAGTTFIGGEWEKAHALMSETARDMVRVRGNAVQSANALIMLAYQDGMLGNYKEALAGLDAAERILRAIPPAPVQDEYAKFVRALIALRQGEYAAALTRFDEVAAIERASHYADQSKIAEALMYQAEAHARLGASAQALTTSEKALAMLREANGEDSRFVVQALYRTGLAHRVAGDKARAQKDFAAVLERGARAFGSADHPEFVELRAQIAAVSKD